MNMFQQLAQMQFNWKVGNYDPNEVGIFFAALCFITSYLFSGANPYVPMSYRLNTIVVSSVMVGVMSGAITYYNNNMFKARKGVYMEQGLDEGEATQEALADSRQESIMNMLN